MTVSLLILCTNDFPTLCSSIRKPSWLTQSLNPLPTSCRFPVVLSLCFNVQIWNTFGLSHPSLSAECENINLVGSAKLRSLSLFLRIRSYADISSEKSEPRFTVLSTACPFLSIEKYPLWVSFTSIPFKYFWYGVSKTVIYSFTISLYSCSNIWPYSPRISSPSSSYWRYFATSSMKNNDNVLMPLLKSSSSFSRWDFIVSLICTRRISFSDTSPTTSPLWITSPFVNVTVPAIGSISDTRYPLYCSISFEISYKLSSTSKIRDSWLMPFVL